MSEACAFKGCVDAQTTRWLAIGGVVLSLCDMHASGLLRNGIVTTLSDEGRPRCIVCNGPIEEMKDGQSRRYSPAELARRKFCSTACSGIYKRSVARKDARAKTCKGCGALIEPRDDEPFYLFVRRKFCTIDCYIAWSKSEKQRRRGLV